MAETSAAMPAYGTPFLNGSGLPISEPWFRFLLALQLRTGGQAGSDFVTQTQFNALAGTVTEQGKEIDGQAVPLPTKAYVMTPADPVGVFIKPPQNLYEGTVVPPYGTAAQASAGVFLRAANNLSDLTNASTARTNLGLGTIATQAASGVAITGGAIDGTTVGATTPASGAFTTLSAVGNDALSYQTTNALSIPNGAATTITTWGIKLFDRVNTNFNATTGIFTAPVAGIYHVAANITFASTTGGAGISQSLRIVANGVSVASQQLAVPTTTGVASGPSCAATVSIAAGQTILIQAFQNSGAAVALAVGSAFNNQISIHRVP